MSVLNNSGQGYAGLSFNQSGGYAPPDTNGAAGPSAYVETVNQTVALYGDKDTGAGAVTDSLSDFFFTTGGLTRTDSGSFQSDPVVTYDDQIGRFIIGDMDVDFYTHVSAFDLAVSKTDNPTSLSASDWTFYKIDTTESGFDADYPGNFGYNHDAFAFTLNMFGIYGGGHTQVISMNAADLMNGSSAPQTFKNDLNDFSVRPTAMHDSAASDPMWFVTEHGDNSSIDVIKMSNELSNSPNFSYTNLPVASYSGVVPPLNPNGTVITSNIDSRIMNAAEANDTIVATHSVAVSSTHDVAQWYAIDVSSGTPTLSQQGRVSAGPNTYLVYPSIDINSSDQIGMTYMQSGTDTSTDYLSMWVTGRSAADAAGTMEPSVLVPAGAGQTNYSDFSSGGRAGDLSGINVDPVDGTFWAANEFANTQSVANWGTAIANFAPAPPANSADLAVSASGPSSVTAGTNATYTITLVNNGPHAAQGVVLSDVLPTGSTLVSMNQTSGSDAFTFAQSGGTITETAGADIAAGSSDTFTLVVLASSTLVPGSDFSDTASVTSSTLDANMTNNTAAVAGKIAGVYADLAVSNSGPSSVRAGTNATYTITLVNNGADAAQNVVLSNALPTGSTLVSMTQTAGTDAFTFAQSGGTITETAGADIAAGSSDTFTLVVSAPASLTPGSDFSDTASVTSSTIDPNTANNTAAVVGSIAFPSADLAVANSGPSSVAAGTNATYTITLSNTGPDAAQGVVLTDTLPAGSILASMTQTAGTDSFTFAQSGGTITETAGADIAAGSSDTFTLVVSAPASLTPGSVFSDTASVTSSTNDPNTANNTAVVSGTIVAPASADLAVSSTGPSSVTAGTNATYTITLVNNGPDAAQGVVLSDVLPAGSTLVSMYLTSGYDGFTFAQSGGTITETATSGIAAGNSDTFTLVVSAPLSLAAGADFSNDATVNSSTGDPNTANNTTVVAGAIAAPSADLTVSSNGPSSVTAGKNATYTITVVNNGPDAAHDVVLSDVLPAGSTLVSIYLTSGYDAFTFAQSGNTITETATAGIAAGGSDTFTLAVSAPLSLAAGADFSNDATVDGSTADPNTANNTTVVAGAIAAPSADLSVSILGPSSVIAGTNATYTITQVNNGPNVAQGVVLSDVLPAGSTLVSMYLTSGYDPFTFAQSGDTITETAASGIAAGGTDTFTLVVSAPASLAPGSDFSDTATVSSDTSDPNMENNTAVVAGSIVDSIPSPSADLVVASNGPSSVTAGKNATYTITLVNNGPDAAQGVVLSDVLPAGSTLVSIYQTGGYDGFTFAQSGGTITETATSGIAAGNSDTFTLLVSAPLSLAAGADFSNRATVDSSTADPNTANNTTVVAGAIAAPSADLTVSSNGPSSVTAGKNATYTITLVNNGPDAAHGVVLTDALPAGSTLVSIYHTGGYDGFTFAQSGNTITETATGAIAAGNSNTFTLLVSAPLSLAAGADFSNRATVDSSTADPDTANNTTVVAGSIAAPSADLSVSNLGPSSVMAGTNATYTITLVNNGPDVAQGVVLSDVLPAGSTLVSMYLTSGYNAFTFAQSGDTITETAASGIAAGGSDTFTLVVSAPASLAPGSDFSDTATVSSDTSDPNMENNTAVVAGSVAGSSADLAVTNSGPSLVTAGTNATYTIALVNNGPNVAQGVVLSDVLPAGSTLVSMTQTSGSDSFAFAQSGGTITETAGADIAAGSSDTFTLVVSAPASLTPGADFSDAASVTSSTADPDTTNNEAIVVGSIASSGDLAVTNSGPSSVTAGTDVTYTITLDNNGPDAAQGVVLSDALPSGATLVSITQTSGSDAFTFAQSGSTVTETAGAGIAAGSSDTFTLVVSAPASLTPGADFSDTASVTSSTDDPDMTNNTAVVTGSIVGSSADLAVANSGPGSAVEGSDITYTITVTNNGPDSAAGVVLTDTLDADLRFVSATASQGTFSQSGGVVTYNLGSIAAGDSAALTVTAQAMEDGPLANSASATAASADPNLGDNSAAASTSVTEPQIVVSAPISVNGKRVRNLDVATFAHASGVEPASDFTATIDWGDGSSSTGQITQSGTTYTVTGSHTYRKHGNYTVTTTVTEIGDAGQLLLAKMGDEIPGLTDRVGIGSGDGRFSVEAPSNVPNLSRSIEPLVEELGVAIAQQARTRSIEPLVEELAAAIAQETQARSAPRPTAAPEIQGIAATRGNSLWD